MANLITLRAVWIAILIAASVLFSLALACGMPFAGLAALAALSLPRRDAYAVAGFGWVANQAIGFGLLDYPSDPVTIGWGIALGLSALAAVAAARGAVGLLPNAGFAARALLAFAAALLTQQLVVYAASWPLSSHSAAFSAAVLWQIGMTNALAYAVFTLLQWGGAAIQLTSLPSHQPAG